MFRVLAGVTIAGISFLPAQVGCGGGGGSSGPGTGATTPCPLLRVPATYGAHGTVTSWVLVEDPTCT